jgi:hypothetical protein
MYSLRRLVGLELAALYELLAEGGAGVEAASLFLSAAPIFLLELCAEPLAEIALFSQTFSRLDTSAEPTVELALSQALVTTLEVDSE